MRTHIFFTKRILSKRILSSPSLLSGEGEKSAALPLAPSLSSRRGGGRRRQASEARQPASEPARTIVILLAVLHSRSIRQSCALPLPSCFIYVSEREISSDFLLLSQIPDAFMQKSGENEMGLYHKSTTQSPFRAALTLHIYELLILYINGLVIMFS